MLSWIIPEKEEACVESVHTCTHTYTHTRIYTCACLHTIIIKYLYEVNIFQEEILSTINVIDYKSTEA